MEKNYTKAYLIFLIWILLIGCNGKSEKLANLSSSDSSLIDKPLEVNAQNRRTGFDTIEKSIIKDTLIHFQRNGARLPASIYENIFNKKLTDIDQVFIKEVKPKVVGFIPVIVRFKTIESDRKKEYIDLYLFDDNWNIMNSVSLTFEISYDLFSQEHFFIDDSNLQIVQYKGLSFENDSTIRTTIILNLDKDKIFDTLKIHIDTLEQGKQEVLNPMLSKLNDSIPSFLSKKTLLTKLGNPSKIEKSTIDCGVTEEQEFAKIQDFYFYDKTWFFVYDEKAELQFIDFRTSKFFYLTPLVTLNNETTFKDLEDVYPNSAKEAKKENNGTMMRIRPCDECDGEVRLFFEKGKLVELEFWEPC